MTNNTFPLTINNKYYFIKILTFPKAKYNFALYKDVTGKQYFAKAWNKQMSILKRIQLKNEIEFYKSYSKNINNRLSPEKAIFIPQYFDTFQSTSCLILLIEYVNGKQLRLASNKLKIKNLISLIDYQIEFSASKLVSGTRRLNYMYFFTIVHLFAIVALLKNLRKYKEILNCLFNFYLNFKKVNAFNGLINRDINTGNILTASKKNYVIDYQLVAYGPVAHQFANMLYSLWFSDNKKVFEKVFSYLIKNKGLDVNQIKMYLYYANLFDLSFGTKRNQTKSIILFNNINI
jgi:serine/threonine protein kinase